MKLLNHLGLAVNSHLHLLHLLNGLLVRVICRYTLLNLGIMHVIAQWSEVLKLILAGNSCNLWVNLLIKLLYWVDAQSRVLHRWIKVWHFLLSVQVSKIRNRAINVLRLVKVDWFNWVWHLNGFLLSCEVIYV